MPTESTQTPVYADPSEIFERVDGDGNFPSEQQEAGDETVE